MVAQALSCCELECFRSKRPCARKVTQTPFKRSVTKGLLQRTQPDIDLDDALGILGEHDPVFEDDMEFDEADEG